MKKKFIAVSVLICALALGSTTLTSCVDDNESASVTAIRDAKAAQLNALAAASNAEAELNQAKALVEKANAANTEQMTAEAQQRFEIELESVSKSNLSFSFKPSNFKADIWAIIPFSALEWVGITSTIIYLSFSKFI